MADPREPLDPRQVGTVINVLSEQHASRVAARDARRAWERVESRLPHAAGNVEPKAGLGRLLAIAAAVALIAGGALALGFRADSQLTYEVRGGAASGGVIEATRGEATVRLSDGSSILAENRTRFSVDVVGRNAALTRLVSGKLHVRVQPNEDTSYRFIAGPYEVRVVGTEFDLAWEPERAGLSLVMSSGEVRLREPSGKLHTLRAPHSLRLPSVAEQLAVDASKAAVAEPAPATPATPAATAEPVKAAPSPEPAPAPRTPVREASPSWDALVAKGQFADVVREAESLGVESVISSRGPSDLKALGQAARYVGQRALALKAFAALRQRSRGTDWAQQAAFFLARLHEEQGNQAEALRWLGTYVSEAPRGVYAAEAYGRRLSLTERLRGKQAALPLARDYLERFPQGAYAQLARGIAEQR